MRIRESLCSTPPVAVLAFVVAAAAALLLANPRMPVEPGASRAETIPSGRRELQVPAPPARVGVPRARTGGIDWDFISDLEGGRRVVGYVPGRKRGRSGVTVATGVDLGRRTVREIRALEIPDALKSKLKPYARKTGKDADQYRRKRPLILTAEEARALDRAVRVRIVRTIEALYDRTARERTFASLPAEAQTVIASVAFQYGPRLHRRTPRFWQAVRRQDWGTAVRELRNFRDRYPTRRRREAELLARIVS